MNDFDYEKYEILKDLFLSDNILPVAEEFLIRKKHKGGLELLEEIKLNQKNLKKEIWTQEDILTDGAEATFEFPDEGFLAFIDRKGAMRYYITISLYKKEIFAIDLYKGFHTKRKISHVELLKKEKLNPKNFIFNDYGIPKTFYEDDHEVFELTAQSFLPNEFEENLKGKIIRESNLLMFSYSIYKGGSRYSYTMTYIDAIVPLDSLGAARIIKSNSVHDNGK